MGPAASSENLVTVSEVAYFYSIQKKKQEILIAKTIGYSHFVFNFLLSEWMSLVKEENQIA